MNRLAKRLFVSITLSSFLLPTTSFAAESEGSSPSTKAVGAPAGSSVSMQKKMPLVVAHRGGKKWAPENTMAAFKKCLEHKVWGIELDIHRCKTGELVVIHDENLERTTSGTGRVSELSFDEIRKASAGSRFSKEFESERIPSLKEVLELIDGKLVLNIEIKNAPTAYPGIDDDLLKMLQTYKHPETIIISSFDHELLKRIHEKAPQYKVAFLNDGILVDTASYAKALGASAWNPNFGDLRADNVKAAKDNGVGVYVWTVNRPEDWSRAVTMGVDGIITDDPIGLQEFLSKPTNSSTASL